MSDDFSERLAKAYGAKDQPELNAAYDDWALHYDRDVMSMGYTPHALVAGMAARHLPAGEGPILDVGAGTGLVGSLMQAFGFGELTAFDMNAEMLKVAAARGCYRETRQGLLGEPLPFPDGRFAAFVSAGTFTAGHAPADCFEELARVVRPGGSFLLTLRADDGSAEAYLASLGALERAGAIAPQGESLPIRAFLLDPQEAHILSVVKVYRRL